MNKSIYTNNKIHDSNINISDLLPSNIFSISKICLNINASRYKKILIRSLRKHLRNSRDLKGNIH